MKFLVVGAVIAALALLDISLERTERGELSAAARTYEQNGLRLLKEGRFTEAVEALRQAHILDRRNAAYQLALVSGLTAAGKLNEAESLLNETLQEDSNDGEANLQAARLMAAKGDPEQAESYYHRAIYGEWPHNAEERRRETRLELIDYLSRYGKPQALLAEVIGLDAEAGKDDPVKRSVAALYLKAGSPARAAQAYQSFIAKDQQDASLYEGLGEAKLAMGDYNGALAAFLKAFRLRPNDNAIRRRMELASSMAALDPTPRRLSSREKYRRSSRILELAHNRYANCSHEQPADADASDPAPTQITNELTESILTQAEQIWKQSLTACGPSTSAAEEPLRLIMLKLVQQ